MVSFLIENMKKSLIFLLQIADRHSLIKGKNNNSYVCQHVAIVYEVSKGNKGRTTLSAEPSVNREVSVESLDRSVIPSTRSVSPHMASNLSDEDRDSNCTNNSSHSDLSVGNSQYSDVSVSPVPSPVALERSCFPQILIDAYEPTIRRYRPGTGSSSTTTNNNYYNAWLRSAATRGHHHRHHHRSDKVLGNKNERSARNSPLSSSYSPERVPWSDWTSVTNSERKVTPFTSDAEQPKGTEGRFKLDFTWKDESGNGKG